MDIYFKSSDGKESYQLPIPPKDMPEVQRSSKNEEFESYQDGNYSLLGNVTLNTFSIESWMPEYANKYDYARSQINPYLLINLWNNAMGKKTPIECIMMRGKNENNISPTILDWYVSVESLSWYPDKAKDIQFKASFKEYRIPLVMTGNQKKTISESLQSIGKVVFVDFGKDIRW